MQRGRQPEVTYHGPFMMLDVDGWAWRQWKCITSSSFVFQIFKILTASMIPRISVHRLTKSFRQLVNPLLSYSDLLRRDNVQWLEYSCSGQWVKEGRGPVVGLQVGVMVSVSRRDKVQWLEYRWLFCWQAWPIWYKQLTWLIIIITTTTIRFV